MKTRSAVITVPRSAFALAMALVLTSVFPDPTLADQAASGDRGKLPAVVVNLDVLNIDSAPAMKDRKPGPTKIVDGREVIILVPPSLQKKRPAEKIVLPKKKPEKTPVVAAVPVPAEVKEKTLPAPPVEKVVEEKPVDETKLAAIDSNEDAPPPPVVEKELIPAPDPKVEVIAEPATDKKSELPSAEELATVKEDIAQAAAEKVTKPESEITVAAVNPQREVETALKEAPPAGPKMDPLKPLSILYPKGESKLPDSAELQIQAIYEKLEENGQTVQLLAYASGKNSSAARRLSLGRALAVRSRLLELGVDNKKIEVRALGKLEGEQPTDRVDLVLIAR